MTIVLFSCSKTPIFDKNQNIDIKSSNSILSADLLDFMEQDYDSDVRLVRYTQYNDFEDANEHFNIGFGSSFSGLKPNVVSINSISVNSTDKYNKQNLTSLSNDIFGTKLTIAFDSDTLDNAFYSSVPMRVTYDTSYHFLTEGMTFNWNADTGSNAVVFYLSASKGINSSLSSDFYKTIVIEDNGSFTIPSGFLSELTSQNIWFVETAFIRGNYKMLQTTNNNAVRVISAGICQGPMFLH
jgi:hypothetical protein